jgi:hypothetical protein
MSPLMSDHAARQLEDRNIGLRDWLNWLVCAVVGMTLWAAGALAVVELGWRWAGLSLGVAIAASGCGLVGAVRGREAR